MESTASALEHAHSPAAAFHAQHPSICKLTEAMYNPDPKIWRKAVFVLQDLAAKNDDALIALVGALDSGDSELVNTVVDSLEIVGGGPRMTRLFASFEQGFNPDAHRLLRLPGNERTMLFVLIGKMQNEKKEVRQAAVDTLEELGGLTTEPEIARAIPSIFREHANHNNGEFKGRIPRIEKSCAFWERCLRGEAPRPLFAKTKSLIPRVASARTFARTKLRN